MLLTVIANPIGGRRPNAGLAAAAARDVAQAQTRQRSALCRIPKLGQPRQFPASSMRIDRGIWKIEVAQAQHCCSAIRFQHDLDG